MKRLTPADAEAYREIRLEALKNYPEAFAASFEEEKRSSADKYKNRFQSDQSFTFGAFANGQLIGMVTLLLNSKPKIKHKAMILAMYVTPGNRQAGVGKRLVTTAIEQAKTLDDIEQLQLSVVTSNDAARNFYASLGFQTYGLEKQALKSGDQYFDEEHMVLFL